MVLESFTFQYLKRGKKLDSPEDIRQIIFEIKKIIPAIRSETLKETLLQKFSAELNINKDLLLKADAPETKQVYKKQETIQKNNFENEFLLLIFIMENFGKTLDNEAADFFTFIQNCKNDEIDSLKEVLLAIRADDLSKKQTALFAKAMMIGLELTKDEAMSELIRVSDVIRLEYDDKFTDFLINLAKKKELTAERKENLQKLVNLRDNNSTQEEELIQFLNTYS
jgi:DNA primase